jgi:tetratricopeptide (TPR) repeat protein
MKKSRQSNRLIELATPSGIKQMALKDALVILERALTNQQWQQVVRIAGDIVKQVPGSEQARAALYQGLTKLSQFVALHQRCLEHLEKQPRALISLEYIAHSLRQTGDDKQALGYLEQATTLAPTNTRLINALGTLYKELGQTKTALTCFDRAIAIKPRSGKAWWNRSDLDIDHANNIPTMESQLTRLEANSPQRPYFHFALYRSYEAVGEYDNAFAHLQKGNTAKKALLAYDVSADLEYDRVLTDFFRQHFVDLKQKVESSGYAPATCTPIFIVGMPRSGTSLVEQILASHSNVNGCGEIAALPQATEWVLHQHAQKTDFPHALAALSAAQLISIGEQYQRLTNNLKNGFATLTDKFLLNYKAIPLIGLTLPNARIIYLSRDGMDTCFGCYRQLFHQGLGFTYSLQDLAKTFNSHAEMIASWQALMPDQLYRLDYQALVTQPKEEIERLLSWCNLPDEQQCYTFFDTDRSVKTASNLQVRKPIFQSGIGRWKTYEKQLQELASSLTPGQA